MPGAGFPNPDGKLEGSPSGPGIPAALWAEIKAEMRRVGRSREDQKLAWEDREGFNVAAVQSSCPPTVELHHRSPFTTDIKTPYSNLTAEVEWWHGSSRVPCCIHRILMAVRQRPQAVGQLYKPRPIVLPIAPRWHAITQTVFTFGFCLVFFLLLILHLTSLPLLLLQQQGALPALCLILRHLCLSLWNHVLAGTRHNCITEMQR